MDPRQLQVKAGDAVVAAWNALLEFLGRTTILPGPGIYLSRTPGGTVVGAGPRRGFGGAFRVSWGAEQVTVGLGTVNGIEPMIGKLRISEPGAFVKPPKLDPEKPAWVALAVTVDSESGRIPQEPTSKDLTIEVLDRWPQVSEDWLTGYHPIAMRYKGRVHQIAYFDYQHSTAQGAGRGLRHFFHPA
jgi:hypothetical protein